MYLVNKSSLVMEGDDIIITDGKETLNKTVVSPQSVLGGDSIVITDANETGNESVIAPHAECTALCTCQAFKDDFMPCVQRNCGIFCSMVDECNSAISQCSNLEITCSGSKVEVQYSCTDYDPYYPSGGEGCDDGINLFGVCTSPLFAAAGVAFVCCLCSGVGKCASDRRR